MNIFTLFLGLFLFWQNFSYAEDFVVKLVTHNQYPYSYYEDEESFNYKANDSFKGLSVDVIRCAFAAMGQPYEIYVVPWSRATYLASSGEMDGFFSASQKDSRDMFAVLSTPVADQTWQWYWLKDNSKNPTQKDFKENGTIGGFMGANMFSWAKSLGYKPSVEVLNTDLLVQALDRKRMDALIANKAVVEAALVKYDMVDKVDTAFAKDMPMGVYFTKRFLAKKPNFMDDFNKNVILCRQR